MKDNYPPDATIIKMGELTHFQHTQEHNHEIMRKVNKLENEAIKIISDMDLNYRVGSFEDRLKEIYTEIDQLQDKYKKYDEVKNYDLARS